MEEKPKENKKSKSDDKQLYWVLGVMVGLIAIFFIASAIVEGTQKFRYEGITFTKEMFGDIQLYRYDYVTDTTPATGRVIENVDPRLVTVYLRGDPRENSVPVEGGEISFIGGKKVYVTIDGNGLEECEYGQVAMASLASFLDQNGFAFETAMANEADAKESETMKYVTCWNTQKNPVIIVRSGEETKINVVNENCYEIITSPEDCGILPATEKFIVQSIIDAKESQQAEELSSLN